MGACQPLSSMEVQVDVWALPPGRPTSASSKKQAWLDTLIPGTYLPWNLMQAKPLSRWWTVVAGAMGCAVGAGIVILYTFGIFAKSFTAEFAWSRAVYSFCQTSFLLATGFGTVTLGLLIHRWGVRRPSMIFVAVFAATIAVLPALPASPSLFYSAFALLGMSGAAATAMPYAISVSGWFDRNRGLALGLINMGAGLGSAIAPQYANYLDQRYGWRIGLLGVAGAVAIVALSGLFFLVREPPRARNNGRSDERNSHDYLRTRQFWLIALPVVGISIATFGVMGSLVTMLGDRHVDAASIATVLSTAGLSSWCARVLVGLAMDRIFAPYIAAATFIFAFIGLALVASASTQWELVSGAVLIGFALGGEGDLLTFLVSRYFDSDIYSRVLGAMWVVWAWGGGLGTWLMGITYQATQSYAIALSGFGLILLIAAILICRLGPYTQAPKSRATGSAYERRSA